jgi:hypothetical protein
MKNHDICNGKNLFQTTILIIQIFQFTTTEPKMRFSDIDQMVKEECHVTEDPFMDSFNVAVDPKFLEIGARIIPAPNCEFSVNYYKFINLQIEFKKFPNRNHINN